jgi:hypothetical protein
MFAFKRWLTLTPSAAWLGRAFALQSRTKAFCCTQRSRIKAAIEDFAGLGLFRSVKQPPCSGEHRS